MPIRHACDALAIASAALLTVPTIAAPSTSAGQISVAQVFDLLDRAGKDNAVRNTLTAYLAGVGESTGMLVSDAAGRSNPIIHCSKPFSLSDGLARKALQAAAPDRGRWAEMPATAILVTDMLQRAGCR